MPILLKSDLLVLCAGGGPECDRADNELLVVGRLTGARPPPTLSDELATAGAAHTCAHGTCQGTRQHTPTNAHKNGLKRYKLLM